MTAISFNLEPSTTAIACATGGFKGVFVAGVLSAFEASEWARAKGWGWLIGWMAKK
jgi:hypothetical protein